MAKELKGNDWKQVCVLKDIMEEFHQAYKAAYWKAHQTIRATASGTSTIGEIGVMASEAVAEYKPVSEGLYTIYSKAYDAFYTTYPLTGG